MPIHYYSNICYFNTSSNSDPAFGATSISARPKYQTSQLQDFLLQINNVCLIAFHSNQVRMPVPIKMHCVSLHDKIYQSATWAVLLDMYPPSPGQVSKSLHEQCVQTALIFQNIL